MRSEYFRIKFDAVMGGVKLLRTKLFKCVNIASFQKNLL